MIPQKDCCSEIEKRIDIIEDDIANINPQLLKILLKDKTTNNNILWCTKDYDSLGPDYDERAQIYAEHITSANSRRKFCYGILQKHLKKELNGILR